MIPGGIKFPEFSHLYVIKDARKRATAKEYLMEEKITSKNIEIGC